MKALEDQYIAVTAVKSKTRCLIKIREAKHALINQHQQKLAEEFMKPYTEKELDDFFTKLIFKLSTDFKNKP
jgi:hypothetical protein